MNGIDQGKGFSTEGRHMAADHDDQHENRHNDDGQHPGPVPTYHLFRGMLLGFKYQNNTEHVVQNNYQKLYKDFGNQLIEAEGIAHKRKADNLDRHGNDPGTEKCSDFPEELAFRLYMPAEYKKLVDNIRKNHSRNNGYDIADIPVYSGSCPEEEEHHHVDHRGAAPREQVPHFFIVIHPEQKLLQ